MNDSCVSLVANDQGTPGRPSPQIGGVAQGPNERIVHEGLRDDIGRGT
jgi:hypothetical protein